MNKSRFILLFVAVGYISAVNSLSDLLRSKECPPWQLFSHTTNSCQCAPHPRNVVTCTNDSTLLKVGYCMSHSGLDGTYLAQCPYFHLKGYEIVRSMYIKLPRNKTELSDYMCGTLGRRSKACRRCKHGYGPTLTSIGYYWYNYKGIWYGILRYLFIQFVPLTIFYVIVICLHVRLTSPVVTSFILCSQFVLYGMMTDILVRESIVAQTKAFSLYSAGITIYGLWNTDFLKHVLHPFCISNKLKQIHIVFLNYATAVYPLLLIAIIYLTVELHGRNFRPITWVWRPFHKCFVRLRRKWDTKSDIIDALATSFLLLFSKFMYQSFELLSCQNKYKMNSTETDKIAIFDLDSYCFRKRHLPYAIFAVVFLLVFVCLPILVILMYPLRLFRSLLSKCKLGINSQVGSSIHFFTERFYSQCRDGLDGDKDMRSFSCLHFILMMVIMTHHQLYHFYPSVGNPSLVETVLFSASALLIGLSKPYKSDSDTVIISLLLSTLALRSLFTTVYVYAQDSQVANYSEAYAILIMVTTLLPHIMFCILIMFRVLTRFCKSNFDILKTKFNDVMHRCRGQSQEPLSPAPRADEETQCLVQPVEVVNTTQQYGSC